MKYECIFVEDKNIGTVLLPTVDYVFLCGMNFFIGEFVGMKFVKL